MDSFECPLWTEEAEEGAVFAVQKSSDVWKGSLIGNCKYQVMLTAFRWV